MKTWLGCCTGLGMPILKLIVGLVCFATPSAQANPTPVVLQQGVQPLWSHMSVMAEPMSRPNPDEAQAWFESHPPLILSHEQAQVGSWVPQPRWARLVIRNQDDRPRTKVLVHPSTTQDEVRVWRRVGNGWQELKVSSDADWSGEIKGALQPSWWLEFEPHSQTELLIQVNGHNRVRFPLQLMEWMDHKNLEKTSVALSVALLIVPLAMTLVALAFWSSAWPASMQLLLGMAAAEWVGMLWVSGLGVWWVPEWDRWTWGKVGQMAYGCLMTLGLGHAFVAVRKVLPQWVGVSLVAGVLALVLGLPTLALEWPWSVRFALVWLGSAQAFGLLVLSHWAYRRSPCMETRQLVVIWSIYVLSAAVYHLHRWLDWSVQVTLWANVMQGAAIALVFAASIWQQAMSLRDEQRDELQRLRDRQVWWAMLQHDLWQPIDSMRRCVALLQARPNSQSDEVMSALRHACDSLDDFTQGQNPLLPQAQAPSHDPDAVDKVTEVDLRELMDRMVEEYRPVSHRLFVSLRCRAQPLKGRLNPNALRRLIRNLLTNALRHTPKAGRILLALRRREGHIWLHVIDTGEGMSEVEWHSHAQAEHAWRASHALWQSNAQMKGQQGRKPGWGLGLYSE